MLFNLAAKIVRLSRDLDEVVTIRDTLKELHCLELGTRYRALSAEDATAHGQSPIFAIHDELGQVRGPVSKLYNAIENAMGAHEAPMSIIISTQAPTDADLLSVLIDNALDEADPTTVLSLYTADPLLDPFSDEALLAGESGGGRLPEHQGTAAPGGECAADAVAGGALPELYAEPAGRRQLAVRLAVGVEGMRRRSGAGLRGPAGVCRARPVERVRPDGVCGDGAGRRGLARPADVLAAGRRAAREGGRRPGGLRRLARARASWRRHRARPSITGLSPRSSADFCQANDVRRIAFDRWGLRHLKPLLADAGFAEEQLEGDAAIFEPFGQGYQSMSPALLSLEALVLNGRLRHGRHPVLSMCAANATVQMDPAGNRKLSKLKSHGRIDGMVALAMAASVAGTWEATPVFDVLSMIG